MDDKQCTNEGLRELALFAGAGGGILGGILLGWRTVCAVEIEPYAASVLMQRQNDGILDPFPIWDDIRTFDGKPWRGIVDVVSGGFPCQDISVAGKGEGIDGKRSGLWSEMGRIIGEVRPRFVFVENSPALTVRGLGRVLGDLAALGYNVEWGVLGAVHAGAPHKRERIWIIANAFSDSGDARRPEPTRQQRQARLTNGGDDVADSGCRRCRGTCKWEMEQPGRTETISTGQTLAYSSESIGSGSGLCQAEQVGNRRQSCNGGCDVSDADSPRELQPQGLLGYQRRWVSNGNWWATEPDVGRVAHGVAARVDRLKAIGNGQVPIVAALAWRILSGQK